MGRCTFALSFHYSQREKSLRTTRIDAENNKASYRACKTYSRNYATPFPQNAGPAVISVCENSAFVVAFWFIPAVYGAKRAMLSSRAPAFPSQRGTRTQWNFPKHTTAERSHWLPSNLSSLPCRVSLPFASSAPVGSNTLSLGSGRECNLSEYSTYRALTFVCPNQSP